MKFKTLLLAALTLPGCGTIDTVFRDDAVVSQALKDSKSHCDTVPRVYSGVAYNFCILHAPPPLGDQANKENLAPSKITDLFISGVLDTLLLPYTLFQQSTRGSIVVSE